MQNLLEVLGDEKTDFGALRFQNDVGGHRSAVQQRANVAGGDTGFLDQLLNAIKNADGLIAGR